MTAIQERSAGVIPYRSMGTGALVPGPPLGDGAQPARQVGVPQGGHGGGRDAPRDRRARVPGGDRPVHWSFREGFERSLSYTYIRRGRKVLKTVTYYLVEVHDDASLACSPEHVEDPSGHWHHWGTFEQISRLLYHAKIRQVFAEADAWLRVEHGLRGEDGSPPAEGGPSPVHHKE